MLPASDATLTLGDGDTATIPSAGNPDLLPAGTQLQITEPDDPNYDVVIDPSDPWILVSDGTPVGGVITVTNTHLLSTGFAIEKELIDPDGDVGDLTYTGTWVCTYPDASTTVGSGTWSLKAGETTVVAGTGLPVGSTCTVTEDPLPPTTGGTWKAPLLGGTVVLGVDGEGSGGSTGEHYERIRPRRAPDSADHPRPAQHRCIQRRHRSRCARRGHCSSSPGWPQSSWDGVAAKNSAEVVPLTTPR